MAVIDAKKAAGVDVKRTSPTVTMDVLAGGLPAVQMRVVDARRLRSRSRDAAVALIPPAARP
jgi:hypothetical protein